jgi:8-oxo-dGTP pyrophosphatase MutT (NUDIX family)
MPFKTHSQEYLNKHIYFTARKDSYETDTGKIVDPYFIVEMPDCVVAVPFTADGDIIFIEQYRHPINALSIELPGGFIDTNEPKEIAIARELLEETGCIFKEIIYLGKTYSNPGVLNNVTHLYLANGGEKIAQQCLDDNEEINILLKSVEEVKEMIERNEIKQSLHELCLYKAFEHLEKKK